MSVPRRFRKKPVVITAVQWTGDNLAEIAEFVGADVTGNNKDRFMYVTDDQPPCLVMKTIQGQAAVGRVGDWVIPESEPGRAYPCDPGVFAATYDEVTEGVVEAGRPDGDEVTL